jgi:hypothetical protein
MDDNGRSMAGEGVRARRFNHRFGRRGRSEFEACGGCVPGEHLHRIERERGEIHAEEFGGFA